MADKLKNTKCMKVSSLMEDEKVKVSVTLLILKKREFSMSILSKVLFNTKTEISMKEVSKTRNIKVMENWQQKMGQLFMKVNSNMEKWKEKL